MLGFIVGVFLTVAVGVFVWRFRRKIADVLSRIG